MSMKKIVFSLLAFMIIVPMVFIMAGCGRNEDREPMPSPHPILGTWNLRLVDGVASDHTWWFYDNGDLTRRIPFGDTTTHTFSFADSGHTLIINNTAESNKSIQFLDDFNTLVLTDIGGGTVRRFYRDGGD